MHNLFAVQYKRSIVYSNLIINLTLFIFHFEHCNIFTYAILAPAKTIKLSKQILMFLGITLLLTVLAILKNDKEFISV